MRYRKPFRYSPAENAADNVHATVYRYDEQRGEWIPGTIYRDGSAIWADGSVSRENLADWPADTHEADPPSKPIN